MRLGTCLVVLTLGWGLFISPSGIDAQAPQRHNELITLLAKGDAVFCNSLSATDDGLAAARDPETDCVFIDMEHDPYDIVSLRRFLQSSLDPAAILKRGRPGTSHPVFARIPAYGREMNQWQPKQMLDSGVHGVRFPHIETVEQALNAVRSMRYMQRSGAPDFEPQGQRGVGPGFAANLWGVSTADYIAKADLWPLDPNGELLSVIMIENELGVKNVREILKQVKGISMVHPGESDLSVYYNDAQKTEAAIQTVLAACKEFDIPCVLPAGPNIEERVRQGFRVFYGSGSALTIGRRAAKTAGRSR
jgi:4-hydroxy-2-oxoheptanedioate aldolase